MASPSVGRAGFAALGDKLIACVAAQGSAAHPYLSSDALLKGPEASRNLSDVVHLLCTLHGRHPGVVDHAATRCLDEPTRSWFAEASTAFAAERSFLARLAVAAGPVPSTPGSADSEAAVLGQRHAIEMLAKSDRNGCAIGAAVAVLIDWFAIRGVLETAAGRFGVDAGSYAIADIDNVAEAAEASVASAAMERALLFGAEQIAVQHFGLWDLLEARQLARAS